MHDLNISTATKNNWERLGKSKASDFDILARLTKRANKQYSMRNIIPVEYFANSENYVFLSDILNYLEVKTFAIQDIIFNFALNLLNKHNLLILNTDKTWAANNSYLADILNSFDRQVRDEYLLHAKLPLNEPDFLGIIYQSLLKEGCKNQKGSYYTPQVIVKSLTENLSENSTFLDPCCGTGSFLLSAGAKICNPENLWGCDIDEIACFIAKINLIIQFKEFEFKPNIYNVDFIIENNLFNMKFDVIATNPPWGAQIASESRQLFPDIVSGESYSYIIAKSGQLLKTTGCCFFVLPEAILNIKLHKDIRKFILNNFAVREIISLGRIFSGVLTGVVILKLDKTSPDKILITSDGINSEIEQKNFEIEENYNFTLFNNKDLNLLAKIYSQPYVTLKNSQWGLGIVTGNNKKFLISKNDYAEKIYTGKEVKKYVLNSTDKYIEYKPQNYQQCAPENIYRAPEKLVYKFISRKLVFAYDNTGSLVLNSANILIPNIESHNIKTVLAFLNSKLFQYIYKKKFNVLKVLKSNLLQMPFPKLSQEDAITIENLVNAYLLKADDVFLNEIDEIIYNIFNLNVSEIEYIAHEL